MPLFRKRPVVIDAMQFTGDNRDEVIAWMGRDYVVGPAELRELFIKTLEGTMRADAGDYVIRGAWGEYYPCKPEIFAETYDAVDEDTYVMWDSMAVGDGE